MELLMGGSKLLPWNLGEKLYIQAAVCVYHNLYHRSFEASIIITYNNENIDILNQKKKQQQRKASWTSDLGWFKKGLSFLKKHILPTPALSKLEIPPSDTHSLGVAALKIVS